MALFISSKSSADLVGSSTIVRFVSMNGSDTSGDGTRANPYLSIWRAAQDYPIAGFSSGSVGFCIRFVPPYERSENLTMTFLASQFPFAATAQSQPVIFDVDWDDANIGTVSDQRFENLAGPLTPLTASTEQGRPIYTFASGTFSTEDEHVGMTARVFTNTGTERFRAPISYQRAGATQQLVLQTAISSVPTPALTDRVYISRSRVELQGSLTFLLTHQRLSLIGIRYRQIILHAIDGNTSAFLGMVGCIGQRSDTNGIFFLRSGHVSFSTTTPLTQFGYSSTETSMHSHWVNSWIGPTGVATGIFATGGNFNAHGVIRCRQEFTNGARWSTGTTIAPTVRGDVRWYQFSQVVMAASSSHPAIFSCGPNMTTPISCVGTSMVVANNGPFVVDCVRAQDTPSMISFIRFTNSNVIIQDFLPKFIPLNSSISGTLPGTSHVAYVQEGTYVRFDISSSLQGGTSDVKVGFSAPSVTWSQLTSGSICETGSMAVAAR